MLEPWGYPHGFYFLESVIIRLHGFLGLFLVFPVGCAIVDVVIFHKRKKKEGVVSCVFPTLEQLLLTMKTLKFPLQCPWHEGDNSLTIIQSKDMQIYHFIFNSSIFSTIFLYINSNK